MAVFCLAEDLADLEARLGRMIVGRTRDGRPVSAGDLGVVGAMAVLLQDAILPNLVQSLEGTPALVHGGPFANIAHGCNSVIATRAALALADVVVTEAGFGADLGAEKFFNIKCRKAGLEPHAVVVVATIRALKMHGGVARSALDAPDPDAVARGFANLRRHVRNIRRFGFDPVIAINHFATDAGEEIERLAALCRGDLGAEPVLCRHWAEGAAGAEALANAVAAKLDGPRPPLALSYPDALALVDKVRVLATELYGARDVTFAPAALRELESLQREGYGTVPICMAKTQMSFSADPTLLGAPDGFTLPVTSLRHMAGAGFVSVLCGDVRTMPGLPRHPAAETIRLRDGVVTGLS